VLFSQIKNVTDPYGPLCLGCQRLGFSTGFIYITRKHPEMSLGVVFPVKDALKDKTEQGSIIRLLSLDFICQVCFAATVRAPLSSSTEQLWMSWYLLHVLKPATTRDSSMDPLGPAAKTGNLGENWPKRGPGQAS
ncbi:hypothetical protein U0070_023943, partial [Myodes glareolus]